MTKLTLKNEAEGLFRIQKHGSDGKLILDTGWFNNLILDQGIAHLMANGNYGVSSYNFIKLGSGNSVPNPGQTNLDNQVISSPGLAVSGTSGYNADEGYQWRRYTHQFGQGVAAGNHSEIGAGWGTTASSLFSRSLIVDGQGNPTTITVLENEFLTVSYEFRRWWIPASPFLLEYDDDGVPATTTVIPNQSPTNQELAIPGAPYFCYLDIGLSIINRDNSRAAEGITSITFSLGLEQGNPSIGAINTTGNATNRSRLFTPAGLLFTFDPPIPKTNEFVVNITIELTLSRRA